MVWDSSIPMVCTLALAWTNGHLSEVQMGWKTFADRQTVKR
jgi:hypothetical protein